MTAKLNMSFTEFMKRANNANSHSLKEIELLQKKIKALESEVKQLKEKLNIPNCNRKHK